MELKRWNIFASGQPGTILRPRQELDLTDTEALMGRQQWRWALAAPATVALIAAAAVPAMASTARPAGQTAAPASAAGSSGTPAWKLKYLPGGSLYCGGVASFACVDIDGRQAASAGHAPWYTGHDEPSVLFYSNVAGSGNNDNYLLRLPRDPHVRPNNAGTGGVWNFQQHPAFWFGMAMCDTQSFPEYTSSCKPDSDSNIYTSTNPASPKFIGKHPGAAFMEMQFYPPGWSPWPAGVSCAAHQWCAALTIDSYNANSAGVTNNSACLNTVGVEPVNFAFITRSGKPQAPPDPVHATLATYTPNPKQDLFMNPGDRIAVSLHDTSAGFQVVLRDLTTHVSGSMTASAGNGFGQVLYQPASTSCNSAPYSFHPMYSTSSPDTRVVWAAHSYNVAFSDEIGHFEYCAKVDTSTGNCAQAGVTESNGQLDGDDFGCFAGSQSLLVRVNGCIASDGDFDGPEYSASGWAPAANTAQPIAFTSPRFNGNRAYSRVAFEADLPRIEDPSFSPNNNCDRNTGQGCVNPPVGASFYPIFSTTRSVFRGACAWQLGGGNIPGTISNFGGNSQAEFGPLLKLTYPTSPVTYTTRYNDFRRVLSSNPC
jgi:hypothetical protein